MSHSEMSETRGSSSCQFGYFCLLSNSYPMKKKKKKKIQQEDYLLSPGVLKPAEECCSISWVGWSDAYLGFLSISDP